LRVYMESSDEETEKDAEPLLPPLNIKQVLDMKQVVAQERFSQRPPRYNEAALVRKLEELGIGRPSTYAPTISTIQKRKYVEKSNLDGELRDFILLTLSKGKIKDETKSERFGADKGKLIPTDIGMVVNDFLTDYFPDILDYNFTANVEKEFDDIAEGELDWVEALDSFYKKFHPTVEDAITNSERRNGERILGTDPKSGRQISVRIGRFGPMVQVGVKEDEEKPQFASLNKGQMIDTITIEEALELFKLPRSLGEFEGKEMTAAIGRFGAYIRHNSIFCSLPKTEDPMTVTSERAIELILAKREADKNRQIKVFEQDAEMKLLNGRYGPYISYKKKNYKIPAKTEPAELSYEACLEIVNNEVKEPKKIVRKKKQA
jgi:DNA topoisomerase I